MQLSVMTHSGRLRTLDEQHDEEMKQTREQHLAALADKDEEIRRLKVELGVAPLEGCEDALIPALAHLGPVEVPPRQPPAGEQPPPVATTEDWFSALFGFEELVGNQANYQTTQRWLYVGGAPGSKFIESFVNCRKFQIGNFSCPSVGDLRRACKDAPLPGSLTFKNIVGDVSKEQAKVGNRLATFQVACQFNCLQHDGMERTPEDGVTAYIRERSQGPACSIGCGPAAAFRNYFVRVGTPPNHQDGQTEALMIDNLAETSKLLGNSGELFNVANGCVFADGNQLAALNKKLLHFERQGRTDDVLASIRVGVQSDTQVTSTNFGRVPLTDDQQLVQQVLCASCSASGNPSMAPEGWKDFGTLVLKAAYEATLLAAVHNARLHSCQAGSRKVFLCALGVGEYGNSYEVIADAARSALQKFEDFDLEVRWVTRTGEPDPHLRKLEEDFR